MTKRYIYNWYFPKEDRWWFGGTNPKYATRQEDPEWPANNDEEMAIVLFESCNRNIELRDSICYFKEVEN